MLIILLRMKSHSVKMFHTYSSVFFSSSCFLSQTRVITDNLVRCGANSFSLGTYIVYLYINYISRKYILHSPSCTSIFFRPIFNQDCTAICIILMPTDVVTIYGPMIYTLSIRPHQNPYAQGRINHRSIGGFMNQ